MAASRATARFQPKKPTERAKISGSIVGEATQKAITGASGTPPMRRPATSGMTVQEQNGLKAGSRTVGRVLGLLLVSETPELSAEEIACRLRASQGAISTATRTLVGTGLVRRRTRPGERRAYFGVNPDAWQETTRQQVAGSAAFREMAERGLELAGHGDPEARRGLEAMRDFYGFWERELSEVLARWEQEKRRDDREAG